MVEPVFCIYVSPPQKLLIVDFLQKRSSKNFTNFIGKDLYRCLFFDKVES